MLNFNYPFTERPSLLEGNIQNSSNVTNDSFIECFKILIHNVQSITNKVNELDILIHDLKCSVFCVSEHWCSLESIEFIKLTDFNCASVFCRSNHIHGGVAIFVRNDIKYKVMNVSRYCEEKDFEVVAVNLLDFNVVLLAFYRSPNGNKAVFLANMDKLLIHLSLLNVHIFLCGDFNVDINNDSELSNQFLNMLRSVNCYCANHTPTRRNSCIDNIITNSPSNNIHVEVHQSTFSDHDPLVLTLYANKSCSNNVLYKTIQIRNFNDNGLSNFKLYLYSIDWNNMFNINSCSDFDTLMNIFIVGFNDYFPITTKRYPLSAKTNFKSGWYNNRLKYMKDVVIQFKHYKNWCLYYQVNVEQATEMLKNAQQNYRAQIRQAKFKNNVDYISNSNNKCKAAWNLINSYRSNQVKRDNSNLKPDDFNDYFISSVRDLRNNLSSCNGNAMNLVSNLSKPNTNFKFKSVSCDDVLMIVSKLKNDKTKDIYDINGFLIKQVIDCIISPLTYCINKCLSDGIFPQSLKLVKVIPVYKKGDILKPENYRPISIVPIFSKIIELVVHRQLAEYFESNSLFTNCQYGFRRGLSTADAVENFVASIISGFEDHKDTLAVLCDLSKAFDCISHDIIISKLKYYGVHGFELKLFHSYLYNRKQSVYLNSGYSELSIVDCGVPQGSVLGPLLFLIMNNDLPCNVSCQSILFADDTTLFNSGSDLNTLNCILTDSFNDASHWFSANGFSLNINKTNRILFTLKCAINDMFEGKVKLLGITIDSKLTWEPHIDMICCRLARVIHLLRHLKQLIPKHYLRYAYFAFFNSILTYGIIIWGNGKGISKVLKLQKSAIRILTGSAYDAHCKPLFKSESILTVVNIYIFRCLLSIKKNLNDYTPVSAVHSYPTRFNYYLVEPYDRLAKSKNWYNSISINLFNKLPKESHIVSFSNFKRYLHKWLTDNPFYSLNEFFELDSINMF